MILQTGRRRANEENIPAEEDPQKEGARLHEENVRQKRQKGSGSSESKGQKETFPLTAQTTNRVFVVFCFISSLFPV